MILPRSFYERADVVLVARDLLGKYLCTEAGGMVTSGMICETEAYEGVTDRASHAYGGRRTPRTEIMYARGGTAYVYLCYGIHSLFNVVTNVENIPHAVLIRGIIPAEGMETMLKRSGRKTPDKDMGIGPGKVSRLLGIHFSHTGTDLTRRPGKQEDFSIRIEERNGEVNTENIISGLRIGIDYAGKDALLPYRFLLKKPLCLSSGKQKTQA